MEHHLDFSYRARYHKLGQINSQTTDIWFVLHGYGQLSQYFIKKFEGINNGKQSIIAPEGLSRFYLNGFSGRVGSTWMTKEDRLTEIKNYIGYLNAIYKRELNVSDLQAKIHLLGFSQGTATVTRWALQPQIHFDHLVLWAGMLPHDMDLNTGKKKLLGKRLSLVYGDQDEFVTEERLDQQKEMLTSMDLEPEQMVFAGGHDIDPATLIEVSSFD